MSCKTTKTVIQHPETVVVVPSYKLLSFLAYLPIQEDKLCLVSDITVLWNKARQRKDRTLLKQLRILVVAIGLLILAIAVGLLLAPEANILFYLVSLVLAICASTSIYHGLFGSVETINMHVRQMRSEFLDETSDFVPVDESTPPIGLLWLVLGGMLLLGYFVGQMALGAGIELLFQKW